jgi:hypothetical protein
MTHRAFTAGQGAPAQVRAIEQAADGTLWLGGGGGLKRFDGNSFVSYPGPADDGGDALHIRIRDDGQGIDANVLDSGGKQGHFGLIGMRERSKKLGAHLEVWSKPGAGTEVNLRVPADIAYGSLQRATHAERLWQALLPVQSKSAEAKQPRTGAMS